MTQNALGPKGRFYQAKRLKEIPLCVMKGVQEFLNAVSSKSHFLTPSIVERRKGKRPKCGETNQREPRNEKNSIWRKNMTHSTL